MILGGGQRNDIAAVAQGDEADFLAPQEFFDDQAPGESLESRLGFGTVVRDYDALSGSQAVGLQDYRKAETVDGLARFGGAGAIHGDERGCRNITLYKEVLCKNLTTLELRGLCLWTNDLAAARAELIHYSGHQWGFRPNHRQASVDLLRQSQE